MKTEKNLTKHQLKSAATRTALLLAAEEIFARDGYERAQIDEIAERSGRTRGAVYAQYRTKEELFFAVQEQQIEHFNQNFQMLLAKAGPDPQDRLAALQHYYSTAEGNRWAILDLELKLYALRHPESAEKWRIRYRRSYDMDSFTRDFPLSQDRHHLENQLLALTAAKSGLLLARLFLPEQITQKETGKLLGAIFQGLFPEAGSSSISTSVAKGPPEGKGNSPNVK